MDKATPVMRLSVPFALPSERVTALLVSQVFALAWWAAAFYIRGRGLALAWIDQEYVFTQAARHVDAPYQIPYFANPPWTAALLAPLGLLPLPVATLIQTCLYLALVAAVILKFGGSLKTVLIALCSFVALDSVIELNVDWLVALGLLVPATWSGPLLLVKPQTAPGYWLSLRRQQLIRSGAVLLVVLAVSLLLWPGWPFQMRDAAAQLTVRAYNLAPLALLPVSLSLLIGVVLAWFAVRRHDPIVGILAGLFFVPYIAFYSLLIPFALAAVRWPRIVLLFSVVMWVIYGGLLGCALLAF